MCYEYQGIVAICGSIAKAWENMTMAQISYERAGYIALLPTNPESSKILTDNPMMSKELLTDMHLNRIDMSSELFVCNVGGYIGPSTQAEIDYAKEQGKFIYYAYPCGRKGEKP